MAALIRALRSRLAPLAAVLLTVALTAAFAALTTTAWSVALPLGARADIAGSPGDVVVIGDTVTSTQAYAQLRQNVRHAVSQDAPGVFSVGESLGSRLYTLASGPLDGLDQQTYAATSPSIRAHAKLTAGTWPTASTITGANGATAVPVAVSVGAAGLMELHLGQSITLAYSPSAAPTTFTVVGEYQYAGSGPDQAALAWDVPGESGVYYGNLGSALYGPLVVAPDAFSTGAVPLGLASWTLVPADAPDVSVLQRAVAAISADTRLSPSQGYDVWDLALTKELSAVSARLLVARGELLAATCLLGLLAGLALAAAAEGLVARGGAQAALMRSRGAPAWKASAGYLPDVALLLPAAALGTLVQGPLLGRLLLRVPPLTPSGGALGLGLPAVDWVAGLCVAVLAALIVLGRAARAALPSQVAAASGRQAAVSGFALAGADLALVALAVIALWQASNTGLTAGISSGGSGVVLIVACAPALTAAAGAALCGRLITLAARVSERAAQRAGGALPLRLAAWELARMPRRHLVPALLSVAAVAGCGFVAAQHSSWQRSAHDQSVFQVGADVAVNLASPQPLDKVTALTRAPGVLASTPVYQYQPAQGPTLVGVDTHNATQTVLIRPDLSAQPLTKMWSAATPSGTEGLVLPGKPAVLGIQARLDAPGLDATSVIVTVQDATGTTYALPPAKIAPDGAEHALQLSLAQTRTGIAYPLRVMRIALSYMVPVGPGSAEHFFIDGVTTRELGGADVPVAGASAAIRNWSANTTWHPQNQMLGCGPSGPGNTFPPMITKLTLTSGAMGTDFFSGQAQTVVPCEITLTAGSAETVIPAVATRAFVDANQQGVGTILDVQVDQVAVHVRIVGVLDAFPSLPAGTQAMIVDVGQLADQALLLDDPLPAPATWWLHTVNGATPTLPPAAVAVNALQTQTSMINDPAALIPQRVATEGAVALTVLALLGLLVSLLSAAREATARDTVLCALGMTRAQRAALGCAVHTAVALPAALLGAGLGFGLGRLLVPVFILSPEAATPMPAPTVLYSASWSLLAFAAITLCTALAAWAASIRRRDPAAVSRWGG